MKLMSSRTTFFNKRVFPLLWFGFMAIGFFGNLLSVLHKHQPIELQGIAIILGMAVFGYCIMKLLVFDLVDEVWDAGDYLVVKNKSREDIIQLSDIKNISYSNLTNPQRVTLSLRKPCIWGNEVAFSPRMSFSFSTKNPVVQGLIERVDAKRKS